MLCHGLLKLKHSSWQGNKIALELTFFALNHAEVLYLFNTCYNILVFELRYGTYITDAQVYIMYMF